MATDIDPIHQTELLAAIRDVGALVLSMRDAGVTQHRKPGGDIVTDADLEASRRLVQVVHGLWPDDGVVSEESPQEINGTGNGRTWFIDPIDGTNDFASGRDGFAVMVGLAHAGRPVFGAVYQPATQTMYSAAEGRAYVERPGHPRARMAVSTVTLASDARLVASRSHRTTEVDLVKHQLALSNEFNIGSIGLKLCLIANGQYDLYVNPKPRCRLWDTCAPEAILRGAGGELSTLSPASLSYAARTMEIRDALVASNGHIHAEVVAKLRPLFVRK